MTENHLGSDPGAVLDSLSGTYKLDAAATSVEFDTKALFGMVKVHGTFQALEGHGNIGTDGSVSGELVIDAASVDTGQAKRDAHLRTKDFFDVAKHPTFAYTASAVRVDPDNSLIISGTFTAAGQTRALEVRATATTAGDRLTLSGNADLDRSAWGIKWKKMGAGLDNHVTVTAVLTRV